MNSGKSKFYYEVYGLDIESEIKIDKFVPIENINTDNKVNMIYSKMPANIKKSIEDNKKAFFSKEEVWFHIDEVATYRVTNGEFIEFEPCEKADPYILRVFLMCSCLGFIMIQRDIIAIHGGTIVVDNKAIILTGDRGAGKSTLTTALRLKGYQFISDDVAALEMKNNIPMVKHGFPYQKLCSSAMDKLEYDKEKYFSFMSDTEIKYLVDAHDDFIYEDTRLFALCELSVSDTDQVQIEEIKGSEKLNKLITNRYRAEFVQAMGGISPIAFKTLLQIAKSIKFYKIIRPEGQFTVDKQIELLEEKIKTLQSIN